MPVNDEAVRRSARVLTRFLSQVEASGYAQNLALNPQAMMQAWQQQAGQPLAPSHVSPVIEPLPAQATAHVDAIRALPLFQQIYGPTAEFKMFELGRLLACQWWVDTDVSNGLLTGGGQGATSFDEILQSCLPPAVIPLAQVRYQSVPNGLIVYSMNNTLTAQGPGFNPATGQVTFALGASANLMMVREHAGRYVLANGYHRAWLLRSRGVAMVPAVVVPVATPQGVELGDGFFGAPLLFGARPPVVDDFLDDTMSIDVEVRSMVKAVKISVESLTIPRLL